MVEQNHSQHWMIKYKLLQDKFNDLREWARDCYYEQVINRPDENIHKKTLEGVWKQVLDKLNSG